MSETTNEVVQMADGYESPLTCRSGCRCDCHRNASDCGCCTIQRNEVLMLQRNQRCVERLIGLAHSLGWDGVNNSKVLDVFLEDTIRSAQKELADLKTLHPAADWTEADGPVLWWHLPICEPPFVGDHECMGERGRDGTPTECAWLQRDGWLTHWSRIPKVETPTGGERS